VTKSRSLRVLLVEDSEDDALLVVHELERAGYQVTSDRVDTAGAMRAALERSTWDVVLADYSMPNFSAPAALRLLQEVGRDLPFIIVSGSVGEEIAVEAMKAGAHDYIVKGSLRRLIPAVERELVQAASRRARRQEEERYRILFENNPQPLWVFDEESLAFLAVNEAACRHYGYSREEFLGMTIRDIRPPEDVPLLLQRLQAELPEYQESGVWRHRKKDGSIIEVEINSHPLQFDGRLAQLVLALDVTERRQLEAQLRQSQKMEAIGTLAGGVAHDFNNLLTTILGYSGLLLDGLEGESPLREGIEEIQKAGERAAALTRQLLAFSRRQVLAPVVLDLNAVVANMEKMLRRLIGEDVALVAVLARDLWSVRADAGQIEQVIVNLVVNARDAMPRGGKVTIETRNHDLDDSYVRTHAYAQPGEHVCLSVSDTGTGIDPETRARIFEPFFTTKSPGKGTGLGLSTVYGIVKQSGGSIEVYSEPGRGTSFKVYLPRVLDGENSVAPEAKHPPVGGAETVLLVEDEEAVRRLARLVLEKMGYKVLEAASAEEALSVAGDHAGEIGLLLTDSVMSGMSGPDLARILRVQRPETRVLFMSGYTDDAIVRHGLLEPNEAFLQKPFSPDVLARKIREVLDAGAP
jgi:two-component system cell cycle sensor histidine kinase/response regulator CckA